MLTIQAGDSVNFTWASAGAALCFAPNTNSVSLFSDPVHGVYSPYFFGAGGTVVNSTQGIYCSGVKGAPANVVFQFPVNGTFFFFDMLHTTSTGLINVTEYTAPETPGQVAYNGSTAAAADIAALPALYSSLNLGATTAPTTTNSDGSTTYYVRVGGGSATIKAEWLRFVPANLTINKGDTVNFTLSGISAHTVCFNTSGEFDDNILYNGAPAMNPEYLSATGNASNYQTGFVSSGMLIPGRATTWEVTFTEAGVFPYICNLHDSLGMSGTIVVNETSSAAALALFTTLPTIILAVLLLLL
jgi:plastocyanin